MNPAIISVVKEIVVAVVTNTGFFSSSQAPSQKIDQVINLIKRVESALEK